MGGRDDFGAVLLRLVWRITHRPPGFATRHGTRHAVWQKAAHHATHHLLYVLFFAVPLIGWALQLGAGFPSCSWACGNCPTLCP